MEINSNVWGASSSWETYNISPINIAPFLGKLPVFNTSYTQGSINRYDIDGALNAGKLSTNIPIDVSVCPWRMRGNSYFLGDFKKVAFLPGTGGAVCTFETSDLYDDYARNMGAPVALTWGDAPSLPPKMLNPKFIWGDEFASTSPLYAGDWSPLTDFDYKKIVVFPRIVAYDSVTYQTVSVSYYNYVQNGGSTRYRYIQGLKPSIYVGGAGHWNGVGAFSLRPFGAKIQGFSVDDHPEYDEDFLTYGDGIREAVPGSDQSNGFTSLSSSYVKSTEAASYKAQLDNKNTIYYRSIPEGWYLTERSGGSDFTTEYDNVNDDFSAAWILEQFLTLGFWVYVGADVANFDPDNPDEYAYAPLFDEFGTTTGEGVNGPEAAQTAAGGWSTNVAGENVYNGDEPPFDPSQYDADNKTVLPSAVYTSGNKMFALTIGELQGIIDAVSLEAASLQNELETVQKFLTNNPIDVIKGVVFYPFNVSEYIDTELTKSEVILGNVSTSVDGYKIEQRAAIINAGTVTYYPPNGLDDFRSYEPYSSAELYIPYCGSVKINPSDYIGHKITVKYLIDIESGGCTALIYRDDLAIDSIAGQIGVQCPITGVQTASFQAAQEQANRNSINAKVAVGAAVVGIGAAAFTGGASLALAGAVGAGIAAASKLDASNYAVEHQQIPYKCVGAASAATSTVNEQFCRLVIHRPVMLPGADVETFARLNGYACCISAPLSTFSGFTQCASVELDNIDATAEEKAAITALLLKGVIL